MKDLIGYGFVARSGANRRFRFCEATKTLFEKMDGVDAKVLELDLDENGGAIQDALLEMTGQKTVPNVFVKGNHIGGNDATQLAAKMGKIKKMLKE